jgi:hypothetical protein
MKGIRKLVLAGQFHQAFVDCSTGGRLKLNGVGHAFFTKIFFFLGQASGRLTTKPLIFDRWTQNAFFLLLSQTAGTAASNRYFRMSSHSKFMKAEAIALRGNVSNMANAYTDYVNRMNDWAGRIPVQPGQATVPAAQLEQFVFGESRRTNKSPTNPRVEIFKLIASLLPPP